MSRRDVRRKLQASIESIKQSSITTIVDTFNDQDIKRSIVNKTTQDERTQSSASSRANNLRNR